MKNESDDTLDKIAKHLAREIFKVGDEPKGMLTHRIEFKVRGIGPSEFRGGGLCESALAKVIKLSLTELIIKSLGE